MPPIDPNDITWDSPNPEDITWDDSKETVDTSFLGSLEAGAKKYPSQAKEFGKEIIDPRNWGKIAEGMLRTGAGELEKILPDSVVNALHDVDKHLYGEEKAQQLFDERKAYADAFNESYAKYGSWETAKEKLREDPLGINLDVATILSLGGTSGLKATYAGSVANKVAGATLTAGKVLNPFEWVNTGINVIGKSGGKVTDILGWLTDTNPEAYRTVYELYKKGDKQLIDKMKNGTKLEKQIYSDMVYNYSRKLGLPHDKALQAVDYTRGQHPNKLGAWDLWDDYVAQAQKADPNLTAAEIRAGQYQPAKNLSVAELEKQAAQAGVDTARILPIDFKNANPQDYAKFLKQLALVGGGATKPFLLPFESPRAVKQMYKVGGTGARYIDKVKGLLPDNLPLDQVPMYGLLGYELGRERNK